MADPRSEPSMEDILASIKRIISDEPPPLSPAPARPVSQPAAGPVPPLIPPRATAEPAPPWPSRREAQPPQSSPETVLELTDRAPEPIEPPSPAPRVPEPPVQRAVERLRQAEAEMPQSKAPRPVPRDLLPRTPTPRATGGDVTLEALVREMLEPMLADWLDRNLPEMVERIVQAEIRRMSEREG
jgi:cell pole-organizing protein PopZ